MIIKWIIRKFFGGTWKLKIKCNSTHNKFLKKFYIKLYTLEQISYGSSIGWNSKFQGQPCFPHGMLSIFISGSAKIGKDCVIFQQVTIGSNTLTDSKTIGAPTIGNNCYIGAGAKIIGKVMIGNNVRIGANSVVYKDVPDNSVVISNVQNNIIKENHLNNKYYSYQGNGKWVFYSEGKFIEETNNNVIEKLKSIL